MHRLRGERGERGGAGGGLQRLVAGQAQQDDDKLAGIRVVLDDQNGRGAGALALSWGHTISKNMVATAWAHLRVLRLMTT